LYKLPKSCPHHGIEDAENQPKAIAAYRLWSECSSVLRGLHTILKPEEAFMIFPPPAFYEINKPI